MSIAFFCITLPLSHELTIRLGAKSDRAQARAEWIFGRRLRGKNVNAPIHWSEDREYTYLVFPLASGDLEGLVPREGAVPNGVAYANIMYAIARVLGGLHDMHTAGLIHHDMKEANVLMFGVEAKIADLGLVEDVAKTGGVSRSPGRGTTNYMSPEKITGDVCTTAVDIWAVGVMTFRLLSGNHIWTSGVGRGSLEERICGRLDSRFVEDFWGQHEWLGKAASFIKLLCSRDPAGRPTAMDAQMMALVSFNWSCFALQNTNDIRTSTPKPAP